MIINESKISYNTCQKSWETLHIPNLGEKFYPLLPLYNVGFWEKYMGKWKNCLCAVMPSVSGTDQYYFRGKSIQGLMDEMLIKL